MKLIDRLEKKELRELLGKCWFTHDGMWFYHAVSECGIEQASRLNRSAIESMVPIEIKRVKKAMNISDEQLTTFEGFKEFFASTADLLIPEFVNVEITFGESGSVDWAFNEKGCFACNGVSLLGVVDEYECGPLFRIKCWLKALGIEFEMDPDVNYCIMPQRGECSGRFKLKF